MSFRDQFTPHEQALALVLPHVLSAWVPEKWKNALKDVGLSEAQMNRVFGLIIWEATRRPYKIGDGAPLRVLWIADKVQWPWEVAIALIDYARNFGDSTVYADICSPDFLDNNSAHVRRALLDQGSPRDTPIALARAYREWAIKNNEWDSTDCAGDKVIEAMC